MWNYNDRAYDEAVGRDMLFHNEYYLNLMDLVPGIVYANSWGFVGGHEETVVSVRLLKREWSELQRSPEWAAVREKIDALYRKRR